MSKKDWIIIVIAILIMGAVMIGIVKYREYIPAGTYPDCIKFRDMPLIEVPAKCQSYYGGGVR